MFLFHFLRNIFWQIDENINLEEINIDGILDVKRK